MHDDPIADDPPHVVADVGLMKRIERMTIRLFRLGRDAWSPTDGGHLTEHGAASRSSVTLPARIAPGA